MKYIICNPYFTVQVRAAILLFMLEQLLGNYYENIYVHHVNLRKIHLPKECTIS